MKTFTLPSFSLTVQVALAHARIVARLGDFRRAVSILVEKGGVLLESAIAIAARFFATRRVFHAFTPTLLSYGTERC